MICFLFILVFGMIVFEHFYEIVSDVYAVIAKHYVWMAGNAKGIFAIKYFHHIYKKMHIALPVLSYLSNSACGKIYGDRFNVIDCGCTIASKTSYMILELFLPRRVAVYIVCDY